MAEVKLVNIKKVYPYVSGEQKKSKKKKTDEPEKKKVNLQITDEGVVAVQEFNLDIKDKEFIVLVGPSGCGKSTTLRMVAGLEEISGGELIIDGKVMNDVAPKDRDIAMVFQNYALYPHMTVKENMSFALKLRRFPKEEIERRVGAAAEALGLVPYLKRLPKALSGGQRQRGARGRAIVREPAVFLFDEPLSNLDAKMRVEMRAEIIRLHHRLGATMIYVTHDQTEAMTMGERIVVMSKGRIQQVAPPLEVYERPANPFVAGFIGTPPMNLFPAGTLDPVKTVGIRPEHIRLVPSGASASVVDFVEPLGSETLVHVLYGRARFPAIARVAGFAAFRPGDAVDLVPELGKAVFFP